jgi:predicted TIM-barrel fold metal-dependent hydrolase
VIVSDLINYRNADRSIPAIPSPIPTFICALNLDSDPTLLANITLHLHNERQNRHRRSRYAPPVSLPSSAPPGREDELIADLLDIHKQRLERMDKYGVEYMILSVTSPGAQGFGDKSESEAFACEANNCLAKEAAKNPQRFGAFCVVIRISILMVGVIDA